MIMTFFSIFGLNIYSNCLIPGLIALPTIAVPEVKVSLGWRPLWLEKLLEATQKPWFVSPYLDEGGEPAWKTWKLSGSEYFRLRYCDDTEFIIDRSGSYVWATWPDNLTLEDTATYLLGPVFGFVLRLRGVTCLHASAVAVGEQAVAFVGEAGAGKSTTAAAFAKLGYSVLSDDIVALADRGDTFLVQPAYPRLRLWPESVNVLYGSPNALPRIVPTHPTWDKRYLDLTQDSYQFQQQPLPLAGIYFLGERILDTAAPFVEAVPQTQAALISLVKNCYAKYLLNKATRAKEFEVLGRLVRHVSLKRVTPHSEPARLSQLCKTILADLQNFSSNNSLLANARS